MYTVCAYADCKQKALSNIPLMKGRIIKGSLPVCHKAEHIVWAGGQSYDFSKMDDDGQEKYFRKLEKELKDKILDNLRNQ